MKFLYLIHEFNLRALNVVRKMNFFKKIVQVKQPHIKFDRIKTFIVNANIILQLKNGFYDISESEQIDIEMNYLIVIG